MWLLRYLIDYSLPSVFYGLLATAVCGILAVLLSKVLKPEARILPIAWAVAAVGLACIAFQAVLFFGTIRVESVVDECENHITQARLPELPQDMSGNVREALSSYKWRRLRWGLAFFALTTATLVLCAKKKSTSYGSYYDDSTTSDYGFGSDSYDYND